MEQIEVKDLAADYANLQSKLKNLIDDFEEKHPYLQLQEIKVELIDPIRLHPKRIPKIILAVFTSNDGFLLGLNRQN